MREKEAKKVLQQVKKTYDNIAGEFSESRQYLNNDFEIFRPFIGDFNSGGKIVDLGCGNGRLIRFIKNIAGQEKKIDYLGIDNSPAILKEAQKNYPDYRFIEGDQLDVPLPDESVDVLFNIRAFHHIPSRKLQLQALSEMKRVLKNKGVLILTVWDLWHGEKLKYLLQAGIGSIFSFGKRNYKDTIIPWGKGGKPRYYYAFTAKELTKLVKNEFEIINFYHDKVLSGNSANRNRDIVIVAKKNSSSRIKILAIPFDNLILKRATQLTLSKLKSKNSKPYFIATPNPEMLLESQKNETFRAILQKKTDLNVPDGFGIILASKFTDQPLHQRVTGTDLMQELCKKAPQHSRIFLLGGIEGVAEKVKSNLEARYKNIKIVGTHSGSPASHDEKKIIELINRSKAQILLVAFGAPKQELWLAKNLHHLPAIKIAMGVGGAFNFIAGVKKRAPGWMRNLGLEWLFRVIQEPARIRRIFNATIKFPLAYIKSLFN